MKKYSSSTKKMTIGLDVGDHYSDYVVLDGEGEVIEEGRIRTRQEDLGKEVCWFSQESSGAGGGNPLALD